MSDAELSVDEPVDANPEIEPNEPEVKPDGEAAATEEPTKEAESSPAAESDSEKKPKGVQKRLDELTRNWREAQRQNESLLELLKQKAEPETPPEPETTKTLEDFSYDEGKYREYLSGEFRKEAASAARSEAVKIEEARHSQLRQSSFQEREREFAKETPDYFDLTRSAALNITDAMADAIDDPHVAYFLANNPDRADEIARLDPIGAAKQIARIEGRLEAEREKAAKTVVSKTPAPAPKIEGADPGARKTIDDASLTDKQYAAMRKKQIAQRA